jgi:hypothetical protein
MRLSQKMWWYCLYSCYAQVKPVRRIPNMQSVRSTNITLMKVVGISNFGLITILLNSSSQVISCHTLALDNTEGIGWAGKEITMDRDLQLGLLILLATRNHA